LRRKRLTEASLGGRLLSEQRNKKLTAKQRRAIASKGGQAFKAKMERRRAAAAEASA
jgi:hypothetical protein